MRTALTAVILAASIASFMSLGYVAHDALQDHRTDVYHHRDPSTPHAETTPNLGIGSQRSEACSAFPQALNCR